METELTSINRPPGLSRASHGGSKAFIAIFFPPFLLGLWVSLLLLLANAQQLWLQPGGCRGVGEIRGGNAAPLI